MNLAERERKAEFVRFMIDSGALIFGDFTLKSGRRSSYMVNTGAFDTGRTLALLAGCYAEAIEAAVGRGLIPGRPDILFGSAYKGIPLAAATAMEYERRYGRDIGWLYNRKEKKTHGEGGLLVGRMPKEGESILIIDDVITAGTALGAAVSLLEAQAPGAEVIGSVVSVDRLERGPEGELSAVQAASLKYGFPVFSVATADDIIDALAAEPDERLRKEADGIRGGLAKYRGISG